MRGLFGTIVGKLAGALPAMQDPILYKHFSGLDRAQTGLATKAVAFIASGEGGSVLSTLGMPNVVAAWSNRPNRYGPGKSPVVNMLAEGGSALDVLVRYGQVMAALEPLPNGGHWGSFGTKASPDWLRHATSRDGGGNRVKALCSIARLAALAETGGADAGAVLDIVFHPGPGVPYGTAHSTQMFSGAAEWLGANAAAVAEHQAKLDASGRVELAHAIGRFGLTARYLDLLVDYGLSPAKTVRAAATKALTAAPREPLSAALDERYARASPGTRAELVALALGALAGDSAALLARWRDGETEKKPRDALDRALANVALDEAHKPAIGPWERGYVALDGSTVAQPARQPLPEPTRLPDEAYALLRPAMESYNVNLRALQEANRHEKYHWARGHKPISEGDLARFRDVVESRGRVTTANWNEGFGAVQWVKHWSNLNVKWDTAAVAAFYAHPAVTPRHLLAVLRHYGNWSFLGLLGGEFGHAAAQELQRRIRTAGDMQVAADLWVEAGGKHPVLEYLQMAWQATLENADSALFWPLVAESLDWIDEALGLRPQASQPELHAESALDLLGVMPKVPHRYLLALMTLATGSAKAPRQQARALLSGASNIDTAIIELLADGKQDVRAGAAEWLAARGTTAALPALHAALGREKSEIARAAIITAREKLGDDVSDCFDVAKLLKEAEAGLAKAPTKGIEWFPFDLLPRVHWQDGKPVDPLAVRWWVVLAHKLKQPGSNALLDLWLGRIAPEDARRLGLFVLRSWIEQDIRSPSDEEGNAFAAANIDATLKQNQAMVRRYPQSADYYVTDRDKLFAMIKRSKTSQYFGSATDSKGVLALATLAEGADAAAAVKSFLKDHGARVSQAKALLEVLAANPAPAAIQIVLATANRFKARTVQEHAAALIERISEQRGWTTEELADRTIPTAGLDERGECELDCGEGRTWRLVLDARDSLVLLNPAGKPATSLPAARHDEEKPLVAEAKKQLATARKELKQAVTAQTERLYEAMCLERRWPAEDWERHLLRHPIVGRLLRGLVWIGLDAGGSRVAMFRPLDDGSLSDVEDGEVALGDVAQVQLAHASLVSADEATAWRAHLDDYEVASPFAQFEQGLPVLADADRKKTEIDERQGWMIESFKLRGAAVKAGFVRGNNADGAFFDSYERRYESAKLAAQIEFTGSPLPEENIPSALKELSFFRLQRGGWHGVAVPLEDVPPVLLAETRKALHRIAAAGTGFDPAWEKKAGW